MKKIYILSALIALSVGCKKDSEQQGVSECALGIKRLFAKELVCSSKGSMEVHLYKGNYKGEEVYFTNIICPACGVMPPAYGYNCEKEKVNFDNFSEVESIKQIYNSCTEKFTE